MTSCYLLMNTSTAFSNLPQQWVLFDILINSNIWSLFSFTRSVCTDKSSKRVSNVYLKCGLMNAVHTKWTIRKSKVGTRKDLNADRSEGRLPADCKAQQSSPLSHAINHSPGEGQLFTANNWLYVELAKICRATQEKIPVSPGQIKERKMHAFYRFRGLCLTPTALHVLVFQEF